MEDRTGLRSAKAETLLAWYDRSARRLPWRIAPEERKAGARPDPYRVWLSEIMLQQTTVAAVKAYFEKFTALWPDVRALARADREEVMKAWAGLGYYSRARNLKACADLVAREYGGRFPADAAALKALPGIGDYTAAAIAAIAFDKPATVVDGNVERVISRLFAIGEPLPGAKKIIKEKAGSLTPKMRAGDYAQAMMDLGATICTPRRPACGLCVWREACAAHAAGEQECFPQKAAKAAKPTRYGIAFVAVRADGAILLRTRADKGLLGGMSEVPGSEWSTERPRNPLAGAPFKAGWRQKCGTVDHIFTHFRLEIEVRMERFPMTLAPPEGCRWSGAHEIPDEALPSVMKKTIEAALPGLTKGAAILLRKKRP